LSANTPWYNLTLGFAMLIGAVPVFDSAARGRRQFGAQEKDTGNQRTFPTHGPLL